jgi:hypothetical protein
MPSALDKATTALARHLAELGGEERSGIVSSSWWSERMLEWAMSHPSFKTQLFRFVDVFPATFDDADVLRHVGEYFDGADVSPDGRRLAGAAADGVILNWLSVTDVPVVLAETGANRPAGFEVAARIFLCPTEDTEYARAIGRRLLTAYLTVPAYAAFHRWLGREPALAPMWRAWAAGDRKGALAAIPDAVVDELVVHGAPAACRERMAEFAEAGVTVPVMAVVPPPDLTPRTLPGLLAALGPG